MDKPFRNLEHEVCRLLRWKSMYIQAETEPSVPPSNDGAYWCSETQVCIGVDGRVVGPEECHPRRSCYDPETLVKFT